MSAFQRSRLWGWEGAEFPYRGKACQGHRAAGQSPPKRVALYRGGSRRNQGSRSTLTIATEISTRGAGTRDEGVVTFSHRRGGRRLDDREHRERRGRTRPADTLAKGPAKVGLSSHGRRGKLPFFSVVDPCCDFGVRARAPSYRHCAL